MSPDRRATARCAACHRVVAVRFVIHHPDQHFGGEARYRHRCPHGRWCVSGQPIGVGDWQPGGPAHQAHCATCAEERQAEAMAEANAEANADATEPGGAQ